MKTRTDLNLERGLCIFTSFYFPDSGLYLSNGFDFYFDLYFGWRDTENQQFIYLFDLLMYFNYFIVFFSSELLAILLSTNSKLNKVFD